MIVDCRADRPTKATVSPYSIVRDAIQDLLRRGVAEKTSSKSMCRAPRITFRILRRAFNDRRASCRAARKWGIRSARAMVVVLTYER